MEQNKNIFPEIVLFPSIERVKKVAHFLFDQLRHEGLSSHLSAPNTGAAPILDAHLDNEQLQFKLMTENVAGAVASHLTHSDLYDIWERERHGSLA